MEQDLAVLRIQRWPALSAHVDLPTYSLAYICVNNSVQNLLFGGKAFD